MSSNYEIRKSEDNTYEVLDEMENIIEIFANRKEASEFVRDLEASDARSERIIEARTQAQEPTETEDDPAVHIEAAQIPAEPQSEIAEPVIPQQVVYIPRPATATVQYVATGKSPTKADRVREQIGLAKANGLNGDVVVNWAVAELGMKRQLARVYVKENWMKVTV